MSIGRSINSVACEWEMLNMIWVGGLLTLGLTTSLIAGSAPIDASAIATGLLTSGHCITPVGSHPGPSEAQSADRIGRRHAADGHRAGKPQSRDDPFDRHIRREGRPPYWAAAPLSSTLCGWGAAERRGALRSDVAPSVDLRRPWPPSRRPGGRPAPKPRRLFPARCWPAAAG